MAIRFSDGRWINGIDNGHISFNNKKSTLNMVWAARSGTAPGVVHVLVTEVYSGRAARLARVTTGHCS